MNKQVKPEWEELREKLAEVEHTRWSDWQSWCHKVLREQCPSPELEKVLERWDKQIATSYSELSEKEKESDREQVDRYFPLLKSFLQEQHDLFMERLLEAEVRNFKAGIEKGIDEIELEQGEFHTSKPLDERFDAGYDKAVSDLHEIKKLEKQKYGIE